MIKALYELGTVIQERQAEYFKPWENPFPNEGAHKILLCNIREGKVVPELELLNFRRALIDQLLYRPVQGANGTNLVPTLNFYIAKQGEEEDSVRKLIKKVKQSLKGYKKKIKQELFSEELVLEIESQLQEIAPKLETGTRYLFTVKLDGKWLGDYQENRELFEAEAYGKYHQKSKAKNKVCAVTYKPAEEVWGRVDTLGFTVNDKAFNRNGFNDKHSHKMFPVSPQAVKVLEGTRKFVEDKMSHNFSGMKYFIVPHFLEGEPEIREEVIDLFLQKSTIQPLSNKNSIIGTEETLHEIVEEEKLQAGVYYDIFFYQPKNAQFLIKAHLQDVMPSRLRKIFEAKKANEKAFGNLNRIYQKKKEPIEYFMNLYRVKPFFSQKAGTGTSFHPYFFTITEAIFYGPPQYVQPRTLFKHFVQEIQKAFLQRSENANRFYSLTNQSFALYDFFMRLQLIPNQPIKTMDNEKPIAKNWQDFLTERADFFESDYEKGVFLVGSLTQKLVDVQRKALNNEPFMNQLNGLRINEKLLEKLWPRLLNKMREYDMHNYTNIREMEVAAGKMLMSQDTKKRSDFNDRISYVFTLGMSLQRYFTSEEIAERIAAKAAEKELNT